MFIFIHNGFVLKNKPV